MDERVIWKNWNFLKNEIHVEDFLEEFVQAEIITSGQHAEIASAGTRQIKAEKFLNQLIQVGERGFELFTDILQRNSDDNRHKAVIEKIGIAPASNVMVVHPLVDDEASAASSPVQDARPDSRGSQRPSTSMSSSSSGSRDGETGEKNRRSARQAWRSQAGSNPSSATSRRPPSSGERRANPPGMVRTPSTGETVSATRFNQPTNPTPRMTISTSQNAANVAASSAPSTSSASAAASNVRDIDAKNLSVDMNILEQELVRIAPTIAELFQKISKTTQSVPVSQEEIEKVKNENERLRKTNRALIEKLNNFQQKIIQLQLENKTLREKGEGAKEAKEELIQKARELQELEDRLEEQKRALEEKEIELNMQLMKIKDIENDIVQQKRQITMLETLHEEGQQENTRQQEEIMMLKEERIKQQAQIKQLELNQRIGDERMRRLEDRLRSIEETSVTPRRNMARSRDPKFRTTKRLLGQMQNEIT
ncbi:hypothetical protein FSP39_000590 [Pinctada imbricata]|uniref:CARD domain-containing protein n=1 Tax=Pinctada imbricata TaxID=66713 RepID=A0AA89BLI5_PINIB|nr:hypothetical protein FSP39_000590 [Pinctada imbricata]